MSEDTHKIGKLVSAANITVEVTTPRPVPPVNTYNLDRKVTSNRGR